VPPHMLAALSRLGYDPNNDRVVAQEKIPA
jgi:hypothetical protein